jgi:hypothetical protein
LDFDAIKQDKHTPLMVYKIDKEVKRARGHKYERKLLYTNSFMRAN